MFTKLLKVVSYFCNVAFTFLKSNLFQVLPFLFVVLQEDQDPLLRSKFIELRMPLYSYSQAIFDVNFDMAVVTFNGKY